MHNPDEIAALVEATIEEFGSIDILINNAAVQTDTNVGETTLGDWNLVLETDFRSYWLCGKHLRDHMDVGGIINVSSNYAFTTMPAHFPYIAVKSGINGMTCTMALNFAPIYVSIQLSLVAVERTTAEMSTEEREELASIHFVGCIVQSEDVAGVALFLATDDAAFVTGASILVDGGRSAVIQDDTLPDYRTANNE